jgi:hypothetical protein
MSIFGRLFGKKDGGETPPPRKHEQAVIVYLDGTGLPDKVYEEWDTSSIEDRLIEVIERDGLGEFDGNETGPTETALFMYGPDAERLFAGIERTLRDYPLYQGARVVIRRGRPGSEERELRL